MKHVARIALCATLAVVSVAFTACESAPIVPPHDEDSSTDGLGLRLWYARVDTRQYDYFQLRADGSLSYGGGLTAFNRQSEWTGRITAEEGFRLRKLVDAAKWMTAADPALHTAETPVAEVVLTSGKSERAFTIQGPNEYVLQVVEVLSKAAARRFDRFMQRLPDAGTQTR